MSIEAATAVQQKVLLIVSHILIQTESPFKVLFNLEHFINGYTYPIKDLDFQRLRAYVNNDKQTLLLLENYLQFLNYGTAYQVIEKYLAQLPDYVAKSKTMEKGKQPTESAQKSGLDPILQAIEYEKVKTGQKAIAKQFRREQYYKGLQLDTLNPSSKNQMISGPGADYSNFKVVDYTYKPDKANNKMSDFDYAVRYQKSSEDTKDRGRITNQFFEGTRVRNEPTPKSFALTHPKIQLSNDSYAMRLKYIKLLKLIVHVLTDEQISFFQTKEQQHSGRAYHKYEDLVLLPSKGQIIESSSRTTHWCYPPDGVSIEYDGQRKSSNLFNLHELAINLNQIMGYPCFNDLECLITYICILLKLPPTIIENLIINGDLKLDKITGLVFTKEKALPQQFVCIYNLASKTGHDYSTVPIIQKIIKEKHTKESNTFLIEFTELLPSTDKLNPNKGNQLWNSANTRNASTRYFVVRPGIIKSHHSFYFYSSQKSSDKKIGMSKKETTLLGQLFSKGKADQPLNVKSLKVYMVKTPKEIKAKLQPRFKFGQFILQQYYDCPTLVHAYVSISKAVLSNPSYKAKFDVLFFDIEKPHEDLDELYSSNEGSCDIKLPVDENFTLLEDVHVLPSDSEDDELDDVDEEDSNQDDEDDPEVEESSLYTAQEYLEKQMMKDKKAAARVARVEMLANNEAKKVIAEKKRSDQENKLLDAKGPLENEVPDKEKDEQKKLDEAKEIEIENTRLENIRLENERIENIRLENIKLTNERLEKAKLEEAKKLQDALDKDAAARKLIEDEQKRSDDENLRVQRERQEQLEKDRIQQEEHKRLNDEKQRLFEEEQRKVQERDKKRLDYEQAQVELQEEERQRLAEQQKRLLEEQQQKLLQEEQERLEEEKQLKLQQQEQEVQQRLQLEQEQQKLLQQEQENQRLLQEQQEQERLQQQEQERLQQEEQQRLQQEEQQRLQQEQEQQRLLQEEQEKQVQKREGQEENKVNEPDDQKMESSIESDSDDLQTPMERMDRLEVLANKLTYPLTFPKEIVWDKDSTFVKTKLSQLRGAIEYMRTACNQARRTGDVNTYTVFQEHFQSASKEKVYYEGRWSVIDHVLKSNQEVKDSLLANRIANGLDPADVGTGTFHNPSQNSLSHLSPFQQQLLSPRQQKNSFSPVRQSILDNIVSNVTVYVTKALANQDPDKNHIVSQSTSAAQSGISSATKNTFVQLKRPYTKPKQLEYDNTSPTADRLLPKRRQNQPTSDAQQQHPGVDANKRNRNLLLQSQFMSPPPKQRSRSGDNSPMNGVETTNQGNPPSSRLDAITQASTHQLRPLEEGKQTPIGPFNFNPMKQ